MRLRRALDALVPAGSRPRAEWSQPNFWDLDGEHMPFLTTWGLKPDREPIGNDFEAYVRNAYQASGIVFACVSARQRVFSGVNFLWRETVEGRPGPMFDSPELNLLRQPWPNGTIGELAARMEVDASTAGNFYATTADDEGRIGNASRGGRNRRIVRMRPDWVTLLIGQPGKSAEESDPFALDARVVALQYWPRGVGTDESKAVLLLPDEFCHYSPHPDPLARFRGMSWLTPVIREIQADKGATKHKLKFFELGASPQVMVSLPKEVTPENFFKFAEMMDSRHAGAANAYRTLYTAGGADVTVVGADLKQLDFAVTQGAGEIRVAQAAGVHPVVLGQRDTLSGSALGGGNAGVARRLFADGTVRSLWEVAAPSLQTLVRPPKPGARLWYDVGDNAFLREDAKDQAEISRLNAEALGSLVTNGWEADAAVDYLRTADLAKLLGQHNGLPSVQQQQQSGDTSNQLPAPKGAPDAA